MLEFSKIVLKKVSFDKKLFKKELRKSAMWLSKSDMIILKISYTSIYVGKLI